ncbi:hypothetical protein GP486_004698 [Trichoglossum hirsutum]|uniref:Bystin n=1 Tax=Trichoglossum hirsutum TaxID=265104 RepID=A0A9P8LAE5_9PEZI|nr:hypothetical protein GP486_004698 [Trichoglossum hirsutum]
MPKATTPASPRSWQAREGRRHNPLSDDILAANTVRKKSGKRKARRDDDDEERFVDSKSSRRILKIGRDLVEEDLQQREAGKTNTAFLFESRFGGDTERDDEDVHYESEDDWEDEEEEMVEEAELDPNDLELFNRFMATAEDSLLHQGENEESGQGTNLTELILEKIAAHEAAQTSLPAVQGGGPPEDAVELPAVVVELYSKIGQFLSRYKSGKLPKPFKIIPYLENWEQLLFLTQPESWSPNACYEATKIFVSNLKPARTQRFLEDVILHRVREDIQETKKLNVHLYKALKKSLYKPAAFFKGFLFPLVESGTCTLREAHIVSSILTRVSIPVMHSAAALLQLCDIAGEQWSISTEGGGATNIFIRVLVEKKYALPYTVIDTLVSHFVRFRNAGPAPSSVTDVAGSGMVGVTSTSVMQGRLPVLWHQSLLAFAQRYKNDLSEEQRDALIELVEKKGHHDIGPEVTRELRAGTARGVALEEPLKDGDDTMMVDPI